MPNLPYISPDLLEKYQKDVLAKTSPATNKRKVASLKKFFGWAKVEGITDQNPFESLPQPSVGENVVVSSARGKKKSRIFTAANLLRFSVVAGLVIIIFLFLRKIKFPIPFIFSPAKEETNISQTEIQPQQAITLSPWNLYTKLTMKDAEGTAVTSNQTITFRLYKTADDTTPIWTSSAKNITPDSQGNSLISLEDVPTELFFDNYTLFLAYQIGTNTESSQRIPISTANIPANLQGYFPAKDAVSNTIPVIADDGSLNLASESPAIIAKEGNLLVEAQAVTITSGTASDGDITINPDGSGIAHFLFEGNKGNFLNAQAPNLNSGSLYYGIVANNSTGYDLLRLQSGLTPTTKFSVDSAGNTQTAGNLNVGGYLATGGTQRLSSTGALSNITGYSQNSGNFTINQKGGDTATITKKSSALSDLMVLTLDETNNPSNSNYSTLVLNRHNGGPESMALLVDQGNAQFDEQLRLGRFTINPTAVGTGTIIYNSSDNNLYMWNGVAWVNITGGGVAVNFASILSGTNTTANMVVGDGASLTFSGTGIITASDITCTGCVEATSIADNSLDFTQLKDALTLDAATNIALGAYTLSTSGTGALDSNSTGQVSFAGNVNAENGLDVTGDLTATGDLTVSGNDIFMDTNTAGYILVADGTNFSPVAMSGDITINGSGVTTIGADKITEGMLKAVNDPTDEQCLTYEATVGDFEWQTCGSVGVGESLWEISAGAIHPINTSLDLLIGGTATGTAKFSFTNISGGTPTFNMANQASNIAIKDATANALQILEGTNPYFALTTTDGSENISFGNADINPSFSFLGGGAVNIAGNLVVDTNTLFVDSIAKTVGIGTATPLSKLHILADGVTLTGKAALIVDQYESQDILTASASGVTKMTLQNDGTLKLVNATSTIYNDSGDITIDAASNLISFAGDNLGNIGTLTGTTGIFTSILQVAGPTATTYSRLGEDTTSHVSNFTSGKDLLISGNLELNGTLFLDGYNIANKDTGTITIALSTAPATTSNFLGNGNWLIENTVNVGQAALMVNQTQAGDIFTASASGTPKFVITKAGNVGIGTTVPGANLDVSGRTLKLSNQYKSYRWYWGGSTDLNWKTIVDVTIGTGSYAGASFEVNILNTGGNWGYTANAIPIRYYVALARSGPVQDDTNNASVSGPYNDYVRVVKTATGVYEIQVRQPTNYKHMQVEVQELSQSGGSPVITYADTPINGSTTGTTYTATAIHYDSLSNLFVSGNVGIGTTAPTGKLEVVGSAGVQTVRIFKDATYSSESNAGLAVLDSTGLDTGLLLGADATNDIAYIQSLDPGTSYTTRPLVINPNGGNVGIGTTGPLSPLSVGGVGVATATIYGENAISGGTAIRASATGTSGQGVYGVGTSTGVSGSGGSWGVYGNGTGAGTSYGVYGTTAGTTGFGVYCNSTNNVGGCAGNRAWTPASDARLKKDIVTIPNALDKVMHLRGVDFNWIDGGGADMGFIAQEVLPYVPEIVSQNADTGMYGVRTSQLTGLLVEAVKEQQTQIASLSTQFTNLNLTDMGDLNIQINPNTTDLANKYQLTIKGNVIDRIGAFTQLIAANIKAGAIVTKEFVTDSLVAFQATIDNLIVRNGLVSPSVQTALISPLADQKDIVVKIGNTNTATNSSEPGKLIVENASGSAVASIDEAGNATFSGDINAKKIYADEIIAGKATFSDLFNASSSGITRDEVEAMLKESEAGQQTLADSLKGNIFAATDSANINEIAVNSLYVTGQAAINSLSLTKSLSLGTDLVISSQLSDNQIIVNSIDTLSAPLQIQSLALAPLEMMAGKVRIETNGNMIVTGDLFVAGKIESTGLTLNQPKSSSFGDLLNIKDNLGNSVASIDSSGSAKFNSVEANQLVIATGENASQSALALNGIITTNATAGKATIPADTSEITIQNPKITDYTLVYVTPTSSTLNNVLYVKSKGAGFFTVGFSRPLLIDAEFNWWVVQVTQ